MFPKELWPTLDGDDGPGIRKNPSNSQKKELMLAGMGSKETEKSKDVLSKINSLGVEGEEAEEEEVAEEPAEDDDEFDDDELGGDYDAEQYFDGGEGDSDDDGGGDDAY